MKKQARLGLLFSVLMLIVAALACGEASTPEPTNTPKPTHIVQPWPTSTPRPTDTPTVYVYVTVESTQIRGCPSLTCEVVAGAVFGEALEVIEKQGEWYEIRLGAGAEAAYVHESVVSSSAVEQPAQAPTSAPEAAPTQAQPAPTSQPAAPTSPLPAPTSPPPAPTSPMPAPTSPPSAVCDCSGNIYNCSAFSNHAAAQACYQYCLGVVGYDVHWLDGDGDGVACETLP